MTQEQVEKLLQPRYKLIADYPSNIDDIGTVYEIDLSDGHGIDFEMTCKKYPNLFRELEWWEEREIEDMPMYLKQTGMVDDDNTLPDWCFKVKKHFNAGNGEWRDNSIRIFCTEEHPTKGWSLGNRSFHYSGFIPATEQDYLTYKQNQLTV